MGEPEACEQTGVADAAAATSNAVDKVKAKVHRVAQQARAFLAALMHSQAVGMSMIAALNDESE